MRKLLGIVAGIIVAMLAIVVVEIAGHAAFPSPPNLDLRSADGAAAYVTGAPTGALLAVVLAWFVGAAAGGWTAARIARWPAAAWIIAALVALGGIYNATQIPSPIWMAVASVLAPALGGLMAHVLGRRVR